MQSEYGKDVADRVSLKSETSGNGKRDSLDQKKEPAVEIKDLLGLKSKKKFIQKLAKKNISVRKISKIIEYESDLEKLQIELVKLQRWVEETGRRVAILFEGRDAAGKGGSIRRFVEHLNPRAMRIVALPKPNAEETGQWYFQRYAKTLPNCGEIVFFDRSWYNRAVVEPVNGFCTDEQYQRYMRQVPEFEHMLYEDGIDLIKFWFSISREEQKARFESRKLNPLKQWKLSPIDAKAQELWDKYTHYKELMFSKTHTTFSPWIIVRANTKKTARLESIRYVLSALDYDGKKDAVTSLIPDPNTIQRFHRSAISLD
ncbi:MAG: polyphosphate kinase 2 [Acidobacteriota bacterium]|nr:polyphosphate kinase 2 [Acidobacteriota bacterium]MDH3529591.1 polyphosphate kinase 2 [Acidobacteriota bacterium]